MLDSFHANAILSSWTFIIIVAKVIHWFSCFWQVLARVANSYPTQSDLNDILISFPLSESNYDCFEHVSLNTERVLKENLWIYNFIIDDTALMLVKLLRKPEKLSSTMRMSRKGRTTAKRKKLSSGYFVVLRLERKLSQHFVFFCFHETLFSVLFIYRTGGKKFTFFLFLLCGVRIVHKWTLLESILFYSMPLKNFNLWKVLFSWGRRGMTFCWGK